MINHRVVPRKGAPVYGEYIPYTGAPLGCMDFCHDWLVYEKEREDQDEKALA